MNETDAQTISAKTAFLSIPDSRKPFIPNDLLAMLRDGYGDYSRGPGEARIPRLPPSLTMLSGPPVQGPSPKLLVRFAHLTDIQLVDDESPTRVAALDNPGPLDGAFRPQEADMCRILNAAVRTLNAVNAKTPLAFVLTGGDNVDNAQENEVEWVMSILDGTDRVKCDSGAPNDPVPGPNNDGKDPFRAAGLDVPWYWVTGNHDVTVQGNFPIDQMMIARAIGDEAESGTRDWSLPGGPIVTGKVIADPHRRPLLRTELIAKVGADKDGHGIGASSLARGKAFYEIDVPGTPLRFIVLDTAAETGGAGGIIHRGDLDEVIRPMFDRAAGEGRWVIVASHHGTGSIGDGSDFGGVQQADAVSGDEWRAFLGSYSNVIFNVVGHSHVHRIGFVETEHGGFWELTTSALADHPHQMRIIEIWDEDNGFVSLRSDGLDFSTDGDSVADEGRRLGLVDRVSDWWGKGTGAPEDRNVELFIGRP